MTGLLIKLFKLKSQLYKFFSLILAPAATTMIASVNETYPHFQSIYYQHNLNASDKWVHYFDIYDHFFRPYIGKAAKVLEIGIQNGGGLQILSKYLQNASIHGVDIDSKVQYLRFDENIKVYNFDITDINAIQNYFTGLQFDIIIDDGSHVCSDVINTFYTLFSLLRPGGVYLVEDLHTSYWKRYGGSYLSEQSSIGFFKKLADLVNFYHIKDPQFKKNLSIKDLYIFQWLQSISFYDSIAVINKLKKPRKKPYERVVVGTLEPVTPTLDTAKTRGYYHYTN